MKISEIQNILDATILTGKDQLDRNVVGAGGADLMADVLSAVTKDAALLTGLTTASEPVRRELEATDAEGRLRCEGLAAGRYSVQLSGGGAGIGAVARPQQGPVVRDVAGPARGRREGLCSRGRQQPEGP